MGKTVTSEKTDTGIEVFYSEIHVAMQEWLDSRGIEDMTKESQNKWNALLLYIGNTVFKGKRRLFKPDNRTLDLVKVSAICDLYIELCYEATKEVSVMGFSKFAAIPTETIYTWNEPQRANITRNNIYNPNYDKSQEESSCTTFNVLKKLQKEHEESLSNMLVTASGNPIGRIAVLRKNFPNNGWNDERKVITETTHTISAAELPNLGNLHKNSDLLIDEKIVNDD